MVFSSNIFIYVFLPFCILTYYLACRLFNQKKRAVTNGILLVFSCAFYIFGSGRYFVLLVLVSCLNYVSGLLIGYIKNTKTRKSIFIVSIVLNVLILVCFKYLNFIIENIKKVSMLLGHPIELVLQIFLPIGISFYIFQSMSYVIDVYRREVPVQKNYFKLMLYICFFPQLIAGPIVRYAEVQYELDNRRENLEDFYMGMKRFILGLAKKVLIADILGRSVDKIYALPSGELTVALSWCAALMYTMEIYYDFSGYSDMAIGMAMLFGFHFNENFNRPYESKNMTEFWRRWHISLSSWLRDYVYIPLGGNRKGRNRTYLNLSIIFLICGIWHGAAWTFVIWGIYHGALLVIERLLKERWGFILSSWYGNILTFVLVLIGWVVFRCESIPSCLSFFKSMLGLNQLADYIHYGFSYYINWQTLAILALALIMSVFPSEKAKFRIPDAVINFCLILLLCLSMLYMSGASFNAFIYFKF